MRSSYCLSTEPALGSVCMALIYSDGTKQTTLDRQKAGMDVIIHSVLAAPRGSLCAPYKYHAKAAQ